MDLSLTRIDLVNVDTTSRKSLRLLPLGKKNPGKTQKVVVGDRSGSVSVFGMKRGDVSVVFKGTMEKGVSCIDLGGTLDERDKIFAAAGQTIKAWSRKGKEFLKFNTNLSEDISSMFVLNEDIYTGGEYIYNHFRCVPRPPRRAARAAPQRGALCARRRGSHEHVRVCAPRAGCCVRAATVRTRTS